MSSRQRRRTFHVDWDSPSEETGTVKRRPASFSVSPEPNRQSDSTFDFDVKNCNESVVQYYELKDCDGGFGINLLKSFQVNDQLSEARSVSESSQRKDREMSIRLSRALNGFKSNLRFIGSENFIDRSTLKFKDKESFVKNNLIDDKSKYKLFLSIENCQNDEERDLHKLQKFLNSSNTGEDQELNSQIFSTSLKTRKKFRTKFNTIKSSNISKNLSTISSDSSISFLKKRSAIPIPILKKSLSSNTEYHSKKLVNSSSESSGIGSPLSPLSPNRDNAEKLVSVSNTNQNYGINDSSASSGLGSPDSPLSPDSQQFSAIHLIQNQIEKLKNCSCEFRQSQVPITSIFYSFFRKRKNVLYRIMLSIKVQ